MSIPFDKARDHAFDKLILAALTANSERPAGLPLESEEELDAYIMGVEQATRLLARYLGCPDRADFWLSGSGGGQ